MRLDEVCNKNNDQRVCTINPTGFSIAKCAVLRRATGVMGPVQLCVSPMNCLHRQPLHLRTARYSVFHVGTHVACLKCNRSIIYFRLALIISFSANKSSHRTVQEL